MMVKPSLLWMGLGMALALGGGVDVADAQVTGFSDAGTGLTVLSQLQTEGPGAPGMRFEIRAPSTAGWVGLGFGNSMVGGDLMIAWVDAPSKNVVLTKKNGTAGPGVVDNAPQDLILLQGSGIVNNQLVVNFIRPFTSMPPQPPTNFLWAMGSTNPQSAQAVGANIAYHGRTRGKFSSNFIIDAAQGNPSALPVQAAGTAPVAGSGTVSGVSANVTSPSDTPSPTPAAPPPQDPINPKTIPFIAVGLTVIGLVIFNVTVFFRRKRR
ncbi:hypothetical protein HK102_007027 [Quaeritorhiza haematococci]|nr:hypothetical protein HK102_007027 [Quaeritorhiza haematococci]